MRMPLNRYSHKSEHSSVVYRTAYWATGTIRSSLSIGNESVSEVSSTGTRQIGCQNLIVNFTIYVDVWMATWMVERMRESQKQGCSQIRLTVPTRRHIREPLRWLDQSWSIRTFANIPRSTKGADSQSHAGTLSTADYMSCSFIFSKVRK